MKIMIKKLHKEDCAMISDAFKEQGWIKTKEQYKRYFKDQEEGKRIVLLAFADAEFAGYCTILWNSYYPSFKQRSIPEITDLNVLIKFRNNGIGTKLMDAAETLIAEKSDIVGIGVGLTKDYGNAQRLYIKRGYIPDGRGISYNETFINCGDSITVDDDLILCFTKELKK